MTLEPCIPPRPPGADSRLLDAVRRWARERPDAEAVRELGPGGRACTYGELRGLIEAEARRFAARVPPGGVLIAVLPPGVSFVVSLVASLAAGVRFLPMHVQVAGPEAKAIADRSGAAASIVAPGAAAEHALAPLALDRMTGRPPAEPRAVGAVVLGSSGTTGMPKLALRDGGSLDADADGVASGLGLTAADRVVFATPLSHSYGIDVLSGVLAAGAAIEVMERFDAEALACRLESGATVLPGVPFAFEALARRPRTLPCSLRLAVSAGGILPPRVRREFSAAWGVDVGQLYGSTELGAVSVDTPGSDGFEPSSIGRPLPGVSMRVVDPQDAARPLPSLVEGQLAVRAPSMLSEYLDAELPLADGHFLTGDLARMDDRGRVWITGRLNLLVDIGAYKVNPLEVEAMLGRHPAVAECVVVPTRASETVQRLTALVVPRGPGTTGEDLRRFLRANLSSVKVPRMVRLVDRLPRTPSGKVDRAAAARSLPCD